MARTVLFSNPDVAAYINRYFEPVWQSVRPVPIVNIDFGNGAILTRTLHGNIATYVCSSDGQVLDVLPGIYEPQTFRLRLEQFRLLAHYVDGQGIEKRAERLREYHRGQAKALTEQRTPEHFVNVGARTKLRIESSVKAVLMPGGPVAPASAQEPKIESSDDVATWKVLAEDTRQNDTVRRRQTHEHLAGLGPVPPDAITKWLYREVLHADLDDPYLGLGKTLFAGYPFKD